MNCGFCATARLKFPLVDTPGPPLPPYPPPAGDRPIAEDLPLIEEDGPSAPPIGDLPIAPPNGDLPIIPPIIPRPRRKREFTAESSIPCFI